MNKTAWFSFALATLGPAIGWFAHDIYGAGKLSMMGFAVFLSWSGFFALRGCSSMDWKK